MDRTTPDSCHFFRTPLAIAQRSVVLAVCLLGSLLSGCAAVSNPGATALPVRMLPPELRAVSKVGLKQIPLTLLEQPAADIYRLAPGDALGVWITGELPPSLTVGAGISQDPAPPIHIAPPLRVKDQLRLPPALGYPISVRDDGTVVLPRGEAVSVQGMTLPEAELAIRKAAKIAATARMSVGLMQSRSHHILVFRQEFTSFFATVEGLATQGSGKRGTGQEVNLPAYQNDVAHALVSTGGLPGLDVFDEVIIYRGCFRGPPDRNALLERLKTLPAGSDKAECIGLLASQVIRIPLSMHPEDPLPFRPEDVVLQTGDIVYLHPREQEIFYTGGLLPPGEQVLPRPYDLDVVTAVLRVKGPLINGGLATSNLSGTLIAAGIGNPSPDLVVVLRQVPGYGRIPIRVSLRKAIRDPRENLIVKGGDVLLLQESPGDAITRYVTQTFFNFNLLYAPINRNNAVGIIDVTGPDRLPGRLGTVGF
jgi:hypothetical protein